MLIQDGRRPLWIGLLLVVAVVPLRYGALIACLELLKEFTVGVVRETRHDAPNGILSPTVEGLLVLYCKA